MTEIIDAEIVTDAVAVLPPDVSTKLSTLRTLDGDTQLLQVTAMLSHSRTGLLAAIAAQDLPGIVECKAKAAAIVEISKQLRLGKDMQLDAAEFVRRAERGLGVAIREGQANGTVSGVGGDRNSKCSDGASAIPSPTDFAARNELHGSGSPGIYAFTDGVSDEHFEEAITEAKAESNLSRANVARKAKAKATPPEQIPRADSPPPTLRPAGGPKGDPNVMLGNVDGMLRGILTTLEFIRPEDIDDTARASLTGGIFNSIGQIRKHVRKIANG